MLVCKKILRVGALVWAIGVALLALHMAGDAPSARLLAATEMRDVVKGGDPVDCKNSLYQADCDDIIVDLPGQTGPCKFKQVQDCLQQPCKRCELPAPWIQCNAAKPWTVQTCKDKIDLKKCGRATKDNKCMLAGNPPRCICQIGMILARACPQSIATSDDNCVIVPPP